MTTPYEYAQSNAQRFVEELKDLLRIPSISALSEHSGDIRKAAEWIANHCRSLGMTADVMKTDRHPIVYAEWMGAGSNAPTVLIYGHYDVQPVDDPRNEWKSNPFDPVERNGNLYARGATDDKGQSFIHLKVFEAFMKTQGRFPVNLKMMIEGEEETGSGSLKDFVRDHRDLLSCDVVVISDTHNLSPTQPLIVHGLRGLIYTEIEVVGPKDDLHSGSYGGVVHNPAQALIEILAQLHDADGHVTIPGFYDDVLPLSAEDRRAFAEVPESDSEIQKRAGVSNFWGEPQFTVQERIGARPTLEINGVVGGWTGEGPKTVIPSRAMAKVSCRLVPNQDPFKILQSLTDYVKKLTPTTVTSQVRSISEPSPGTILPMGSPAMQAAAEAYEKVYGTPPVYKREGGSIPVVAYYQDELGVPSIMMGFGLPDDNLHAPNEKITLSEFHKGIQTMIHFFEMLPNVM